MKYPNEGPWKGQYPTEAEQYARQKMVYAKYQRALRKTLQKKRDVAERACERETIREIKEMSL